MTVPNTIAGVVRIGDGVVTVFDFPFQITSAEQIRVADIGAEQQVVDRPEADYTVSMNPGGTGGEVTFVHPVADAQKIYVYRVTEQTQLVSVTSQQRYDPKVTMAVWDRLTFMVQELNAKTERAVLAAPDTDPQEILTDVLLAQQWAAQAEASANLAVAATAGNLGAFATRAAAEATAIPVMQQRLLVWHNGLLLAYEKAAASTALVTLDGATWAPWSVLPSYLQHWGLVTYASESAALAAGAAMSAGERTAQQAALVAAFGELQGQLIVLGHVEAFDSIAVNPARVVSLARGPDFDGICLSSRFNMAAACVFQGGTTAGGGCIVESLNILCDQAPAMASGLRADLIQYPSAFDCAGDFGALQFLRIQRAYTAFRAVREDSANNGGWRVGRIEYSSFSEGVKIGTATKGPLHFFTVADLDAWPYGFAGNANLLAIYYDGTGRQAYFGRCDNLTVDRMGVFRGGRVEIDAGNGLPVQIDKLALDGDGAELRLISGKSIIGSVYATEAATAPQLDFKIKCLAGSHRINACDMVGDATPMVEVTGGELTITGKFYNTNLTVGQIATVTAGELNMLDSRLVWPDGARSVPAVEQSGTGILRMVGCSVDSTITTAGVAVKFNTDRPGNYVEHGAFGTHTVTVPAGAHAGLYGRQQRADLVARCAAGWRAVPGEMYWADGVAYVGAAGATAISDLPGMLPSGFVSPRHFGAKCDGNNDTTAISAAWAYYQTIQVDGGSQYAPVTALPFKWNPGITRANSGLILTMTGVGATMIGDGEVSQVRNVTIKTENAQNPRIRNFEIRQVLGKAISSIADNGAGKIRVTTSAAHGLSVGEYTRVNGTAAYDDYEARVAVLAVVSTTVVDLDRAYIAPAGAQGVLGGDAIVLGPGTNSVHVTDMHMKEIAGVGIAYDGAAGTRTARNHVEKSMYGTALLEYGENNYDEGSVFETCQRFCIDIRTGGEWKTSNTRGGGAGANNVNDAGGWATMRILGRPSTVRPDGPVEHYHTNISLSGSQSGGRRYDIVSIANNGSGKLRITTSTPHELCVGNGDTVLNGTAAYDAGGAKANVLAVISPTVFDLDRNYVSAAGAVGQVWYDGWDLLIVTETPLPNVVNDQKFVGGNINKTKIDGGYKTEFIGTRLKDAIYLTDNVYNNRIMIVGDGRGRDGLQTQRDIPVYGPGAHRGWSRLLSGIDNPTDALVNGGERLVLQAPYTPAGVGADGLPSLVENGVNKDGVLWRVNGKEATIKDVGGVLTIAGVSGVVPTGRATYGGTANAITLATSAGLSGTIPTGVELRFRAGAANTGATTLAVDGGAAIACRTRTGVALPADYIRTDVDTIARYDGTYWVLGREVERGYDATNGDWTRFEDGTQNCWNRVLVKPAADATTGIKSATWTFPKAFTSGSSRTAVNHTVQTTNPTQRGQTSINALTNTEVVVYYNESAGSASDVFTYARAEGRWFN